mmetsp:Transcript_1154/g.3609  ORF Transcript_1154/g.3609 Transcript_1154/m.3609 type:complete len:294 (+) Transcript_1154:196-1077(+)
MEASSSMHRSSTPHLAWKSCSMCVPCCAFMIDFAKAWHLADGFVCPGLCSNLDTTMDRTSGGSERRRSTQRSSKPHVAWNCSRSSGSSSGAGVGVGAGSASEDAGTSLGIIGGGATAASLGALAAGGGTSTGGTSAAWPPLCRCITERAYAWHRADTFVWSGLCSKVDSTVAWTCSGSEARYAMQASSMPQLAWKAERLPGLPSTASWARCTFLAKAMHRADGLVCSGLCVNSAMILICRSGDKDPKKFMQLSSRFHVAWNSSRRLTASSPVSGAVRAGGFTLVTVAGVGALI